MTETAEPRITRTSLVHDGDLSFMARMPDGHEIVLDAGESGPSPGEALFAGIGGCMAIDVVMILGKMRCTISRFSMDLEVEIDWRMVDGCPESESVPACERGDRHL